MLGNDFCIPLLNNDGNTYGVYLVPSRKSAVPEGLPGIHILVIAKDRESGEEFSFDEMQPYLPTVYAVAYSFAKGFSEFKGAPGAFDITMNGEDKASRPNFHIHLRFSFQTRESLEMGGYTYVRTVDPSSFIRPRGAALECFVGNEKRRARSSSAASSFIYFLNLSSKIYHSRLSYDSNLYFSWIL